MIQGEDYIGEYNLGKLLGEGVFGKVNLGTHVHTGQKVAIKIIRKTERMSQNEIQ